MKKYVTFTEKENDSITMELIKMTKWLYYYEIEGVVFIDYKLDCQFVIDLFREIFPNILVGNCEIRIW